MYELLARPYYRPYIYKHQLFDFHIADTLGNTLGTIATIFTLTAIFSSERVKGVSLVIIITVSLILYEIAHPLLGKPIDLWDILATWITGILSYGLFNMIFGRPTRNVIHTNPILPAGNASDENV